MKLVVPCSSFDGSAIWLPHRTDSAFRCTLSQWEKGVSNRRGTIASWCHLLDTGAVQGANKVIGQIIISSSYTSHSALPYWPAPSYFIHKNWSLWQFWTAFFFFFLPDGTVHMPLTAVIHHKAVVVPDYIWLHEWRQSKKVYLNFPWRNLSKKLSVSSDVLTFEQVQWWTRHLSHGTNCHVHQPISPFHRH